MDVLNLNIHTKTIIAENGTPAYNTKYILLYFLMILVIYFTIHGMSVD